MVPVSTMISHQISPTIVNPLQDNKMLALSTLTALAHDIFNVAQMMQFSFDKIENIVGKGENAVFSPFTTLFSKSFFSIWHCVVE